MRVTFSGPRAAKSSMEMPNLFLNRSPIANRSSLLAGMPTTTIPSFLAAASVFSHSLGACAAAAGVALVSKTVSAPSHIESFIAGLPLRKRNDVAEFVDHSLPQLAARTADFGKLIFPVKRLDGVKDRPPVGVVLRPPLIRRHARVEG